MALLGALVVLACGSYVVYAAAAKPSSADFSLSATSSQTIVPGQAGVYSVSMTALNGFSGSVGLSVSGLPKSSAATFVTNPLSSSKTSTSMIVETGASVPTGTYSLTITGTSGNLTHSVTAQMVVVSSGSFTLSESPTVNQGVAPGAAATWSVNITRSSGFTGSVTLATNPDLPAGVSASFSPNPVSGTASTLTFQTSATTPLGSYPFAIQGTSGKASTWIRGTLNVGTFSVAASPGSQSVSSGGSTTYAVSATRQFFTAGINLTVSGLPTGATGVFSPNPMAGPSASASILSVSTTTAVQPGSYTLTITATGGTPAQIKTTQVTLQVIALKFAIAGNAPSPLYPGAAGSPMNLSLDNPNGYSMTVATLTVSVDSVSAPKATSTLPCSIADFATTPYTGTGFTLPPGSHTLSSLGVPQSQWPTLRMLNATSNQDGCKGASLSLTYSGSAHS
jgi:hypothetical protein